MASAPIFTLLLNFPLQAQAPTSTIKCDFEIKIAVSQLPGRTGRVLSSEPFLFELNDQSKEVFSVVDGKRKLVCADHCSLNYGQSYLSWEKRSSDNGYLEVVKIDRMSGAFLRDITFTRRGSLFEKAEARGTCTPINLEKRRF